MAESTTDEDLKEQAPEEEQLGLEDDTSADDSQDAPSQSEDEQSSSEDEAPEESQEDEGQGESEELDSELVEWAKKKNLPTDNPTAILKSYREAEKALHSKSSEVSELRNQVAKQAEGDGSEDPETVENRRLAGETRATLFYINNPDALNYDKDMAEVIQQKPYLANDLDAAYAVVLRNNSQKDTLKARQEGRREALESTAKAQRSSAAKSSATTKETSRKVTEADIANMSKSEYEEWRKDNDPFLI